MISHIRSSLTFLGVLTTRPVAFFVVLTYGLLWWFFAPETLDWHGVAALATWMMTVFIRRAEHRDLQAVHAKLDHLLDRIVRADVKLSKVDQMEPERIEELREDIQSGN
jgi:low affinity Fe/Cu permease